MGNTNVSLKPFIEASSNTIIIYNNTRTVYVYGAYSVLNGAIQFIVPESNLINSTFSFCNNAIEVSSFTNISSIYGAYLSLIKSSTSTLPLPLPLPFSLFYSPTSLTLDSSIYLDNNYIVFNSSANVPIVNAAFLNLYEDNDSIYNLANVSVSNNIVEVKDNLY